MSTEDIGKGTPAAWISQDIPEPDLLHIEDIFDRSVQNNINEEPTTSVADAVQQQTVEVDFHSFDPSSNLFFYEARMTFTEARDRIDEIARQQLPTIQAALRQLERQIAVIESRAKSEAAGESNSEKRTVRAQEMLSQDERYERLIDSAEQTRTQVQLLRDEIATCQATMSLARRDMDYATSWIQMLTSKNRE